MTVKSTSVIPSLGRWGLSAHADLVYRALSLGGPTTAERLTREVDVPIGRVQDALDELVAAGAVRSARYGTDRAWAAVEPDRIAPMLHRRRHPVVVSDRYQRHLAALAGLHLDRARPGMLRRLPSRSAARVRIAELAAAERHEHLAINTEEVITPTVVAASDPVDRALIERGVRMRTLGLPGRGLNWRAPLTGSEHREAEDLPLKLMVFDRRAAVFPVDPLDFDAGAFELREPDTVARLVEVFDTVWDAAAEPSTAGTPLVLTPREQSIVTLLATGQSEDAVARNLGLSRRTVVYALRSLMDRLEVDNRFQLALVLGAAQAIAVPGRES
jgi:DNA-binding CsgD family transcriptional regulator/sugar-specific transcriptional regulator TrmB